MKKQISWIELGLLIPVTFCFSYGMAGVGLGLTLCLTLVVIMLALLFIEVLSKRKPEPTERDYAIAYSIMEKAYQRGRITRLSFLKGEMFIVRACHLDRVQVLGVVRRNVVRKSVPAAWQTVEA